MSFSVVGLRPSRCEEATRRIEQEFLDKAIRNFVKTEEPAEQEAFVQLVTQLVDSNLPHLKEHKNTVTVDFVRRLAKVGALDREKVVSTFEVLTRPNHFRSWSSEDLSGIIPIIAEMTEEQRERFVHLANDLFQRYNHIPDPSFLAVKNLLKVSPDDLDDIVLKCINLIGTSALSKFHLANIIPIIEKIPKEERERFVDVVQNLNKYHKAYNQEVNRSLSSLEWLITTLSKANPGDWDDISSKSTQWLREYPDDRNGNHYSGTYVSEIIRAMTDVKKENREKFISIVESFALGNRTIREIGPIAIVLSDIRFEQWDSVVENVTALAPKTKNNMGIHLCFIGIRQVDPKRRQAIVKQVLRLEFLRGAGRVFKVIEYLNELDVQDYNRVIEAALLLAPDRCPKQMVEVIANAPKDIDELTQYALQIQKKCPEVKYIEYIYEILAKTKGRAPFMELAMSLIDEEMTDGCVKAVFEGLAKIKSAEHRKNIVAHTKTLLQYSSDRNKLDLILFELSYFDPKQLPKVMKKVLSSISTPSTCLEISNIIKEMR